MSNTVRKINKIEYCHNNMNEPYQKEDDDSFVNVDIIIKYGNKTEE